MRFFILITCTAFFTVDSLRILAVFPTVTKSHYACGRRIILEMIQRGHQVVTISPYEEKNTPNYTWVSVGVNSILDAIPDLKVIDMNYNFFDRQQGLWSFVNKYTTHIVKTPDLKRFIELDRSHFDLVIAEDFFQQIFYTFAYKYKAPLVLLSAFGSGHYINEYTGNPLELAYVPHEFIHLYGEMGFLERAENLICSVYDIFFRKVRSLNYQNELVRDAFKGLEGIPHLSELERNVSLVLVNSHFSMSVARPMLPNIVEVGGLHIEDVKELNQELKSILDGATSGAILLSFGSVVELDQQPEPFVLELLGALGNLDQRVLIKWNTDKPLPVKYKNIYTFSWLPQNDVLAHPNVVLFITHGGLLGSQEAIYHGVPMICIPFYGDQPLNCMKSVHLGYGIYLKSNTLTSKTLKKSIKEILSNRNYINNIKELSSRFRDRPQSALDTAVFWIEYTARHKGMEYAKGPRRNLYWFQYYFVDVALFILTIFLFVAMVLKRIVNNFIRIKIKKE